MAPPIPTGLASTQVTSPTNPTGSAAATLSWNASAGATQYRLRRDGTVIYTGSNTSYTDPSNSFYRTYYYDVAAGDAVPDWSAYSDPLSVYFTFKSDMKAVTPTGLDDTAVTENSISLSWSASKAGVYRIAGSGNLGFSDATDAGTSARFNAPNRMAFDSSGNLYVADTSNHRIRKITPAGVVTTLAGSGTATFADGTGTAASFNGPVGVAVDSDGNVYVADTSNHRIRKITPAGVVTTLAGSGTNTFADGTGAAASFSNPADVAVDTSGNVYVADNGNNRIRKITPAGVVTTLAGQATAGSADGTGAAASFSGPLGLTIASNGDLYIADSSNNKIRKVTQAGVVTTFAGPAPGTITASNTDGTGTAARFNSPRDVAFDSSGNLYVADRTNHRVRKITSGAVVTTLAGSSAGYIDATGTVARFNNPNGVAVDSSDNLYVADGSNDRIRKVTQAGVVTTFSGGFSGYLDGSGIQSSFAYPISVAFDSSGNLYVADSDNHRIRKITPAGVVTTLAGSGTGGSADGTGIAASFSTPYGIAVDSSGDLYVADTNNNKIRKVTSAGVVTTLAGSGTGTFADGTGAAASFFGPIGIAVDSSGNVYVGDQNNHRIRKITPAGVVTTLAGSGTATFADGTGTAASFNNPNGVAVDSSGNVYVADVNNHRIRKITSAGVVTTLAGSGTSGFLDHTSPATAQFSSPQGVVVGSGGVVYVGDTNNQRVRKVFPNGTTVTLAGAGYASFSDSSLGASAFNNPRGLAVDQNGNVYVADSNNHSIRKIVQFGSTLTVAGSGTGGYSDATDTGVSARFASPQKIVFDSAGNLYVADSNNNRIRKITPAGVVTTFAGSGSATHADGTGTAASFNNPIGLTIDSSDNLYVSDNGSHRIRKITPAGVVTTLAGSGTGQFADGTGAAASFNSPFDVAVDSSGNVYVADSINRRIRKITPAGVVTTLAGQATAGSADGTGTAASFNNPRGITIASNGDLYVADTDNNKIRKVTQAGVVTTFAGPPVGSSTNGTTDDTGTAARFFGPRDLAFDSSGNLYVVDSDNHTIRKITSGAVVTTLAGQASTNGYADGTGTAAKFNTPGGVVVASNGDLFVTDSNNARVRKVTPAGDVTTFAGGLSGYLDGSGSLASFNSLFGVAVDTSGNVYVADQSNHRIRKITPAGVVTTLAGSGTATFADGTGAAASFNTPRGVALDSSGNVYVADASNHRIRKITPAGVVTTLAGSGTASHNDGTGTAARFNNPGGVAVDTSGNVYVADTSNNRVRKITPDGVATTLAGQATAGSADGTGATASFSGPYGVAVASNGDVYVADSGNNKVRKVTQAGVVTTFAGPAAGTTTSGSNDGTSTIARFSAPRGVAVDSSGNVYVADLSNQRIRKVTPAGQVSSVNTALGGASWTDGSIPAPTAFSNPQGVAVDSNGNIYVADQGNHRVRKIVEFPQYRLRREGAIVYTGNSTSYVDTGLTGGTEYDYDVAVGDLTNWSAPSSTVPVSTTAPSDTTAPTAPTDLSLVSRTGTTVSLSWTAATDNVGVTGYRVYRDSNLVGSTAGTTFEDTGLTQATAYAYTVTARDAEDNESTASNTLNVTTLDTTAPSTPTGLTVTSNTTGTSVGLSWSASTDAVGVVEYVVYRDGVEVGTPTGTTFTDTGLTNNTEYEYTVSARDAADNESNESSAVQVTTPDTTAPAAPTNLTSTGRTATSIALSWTAPSDNVGVVSYKVYRGASVVGTPTGTTFNDTGLSEYTSYEYQVSAVDAANNESVKSSVLNLMTLDTTAPSSPTDLVLAGRTSTTVDLSWSPSTDNVNVTEYRVYRDGNQIGITTHPDVDYQDTGLTEITQYTYTVTARDAAGNESLGSLPIDVTTKDSTPPSQPGALVAALVAYNKVILEWSASDDNVDVTQYKIFRDGAQISTTLGSTTTYTDNDVEASTTYSYVVKARDAEGNESSSEALEVITPGIPAPPGRTIGRYPIEDTGRPEDDWRTFDRPADPGDEDEDPIHRPYQVDEE